jgi:predicted alpha/beta hydrolase
VVVDLGAIPYFGSTVLQWMVQMWQRAKDKGGKLATCQASPIGRERLRVCHGIPSLGRDLAAAGFPVIRFDYRGEGESAGQFRDATVSSRVMHVAAANELKRRTGVDRVLVVCISAR